MILAFIKLIDKLNDTEIFLGYLIKNEKQKYKYKSKAIFTETLIKMCQLQLELVQLDCLILPEATFIFLNLNKNIFIDT